MTILVTRLLLGMGMAVIVWWLGVERWSPRNRWLYALQVTLWGLMAGAFFFGKAIADVTFGAPARTLVDGFAGLIGAWVVAFPILFSIGIVIGTKRAGSRAL